MKEFFTAPELEVAKFSVQDIITTSDGTDNGNNNQNPEGEVVMPDMPIG